LDIIVFDHGGLILKTKEVYWDSKPFGLLDAWQQFNGFNEIIKRLGELSHKWIKYIFNHGEIEDAKKRCENLDKDSLR